jgi:hypothetical protein
MMNLGSMSQLSTLVPEPARNPSAASTANALAPATDTSGDGSGTQGPGYPVDQVEVPQPAADAPAPSVDRTPTEPLVNRSFRLSDRAARLNLTI